MLPKEQPIEEKTEVSAEIVAGRVYQVVTILHKNIDTNKFVPVRRVTQETKMTPEEYKTSLVEAKAAKQASFNQEVAQVDDLIASVDVKK